MAKCDNLTRVNLDAPKLQFWKACNNPKLREVVALTSNIKAIIDIGGSPQLNIHDVIKACFPLFFIYSGVSRTFVEAVKLHVSHALENLAQPVKGNVIGREFVGFLGVERYLRQFDYLDARPLILQLTLYRFFRYRTRSDYSTFATHSNHQFFLHTLTQKPRSLLGWEIAS